MIKRMSWVRSGGGLGGKAIKVLPQLPAAPAPPQRAFCPSIHSSPAHRISTCCASHAEQMYQKCHKMSKECHRCDKHCKGLQRLSSVTPCLLFHNLSRIVMGVTKDCQSLYHSHSCISREKARKGYVIFTRQGHISHFSQQARTD